MRGRLRPVVVGILFGLSTGLMLGDICTSRAQAGAIWRPIKDPWGSVAGEMALTYVEVGPMQCAVLVAGVERKTSLWCK